MEVMHTRQTETKIEILPRLNTNCSIEQHSTCRILINNRHNVSSCAAIRHRQSHAHGSLYPSNSLPLLSVCLSVCLSLRAFKQSM